MYLIGRYMDPLWGAVSGAIAFKLYQDRTVPPERQLVPLLQRGFSARRAAADSSEKEAKELEELGQAFAAQQQQQQTSR